jgi:hypothetical protein
MRLFWFHSCPQGSTPGRVQLCLILCHLLCQPLLPHLGSGIAWARPRLDDARDGRMVRALRGTDCAWIPGFTRDLPILDALARHDDDPQARDLLADDVPAIVNRDPDDVHRALTHLAAADPPYIVGVMVSQASYPVRITGVTERGRRAAGQWPQAAEAVATELIAQLVRVIRSWHPASTDRCRAGPGAIVGELTADSFRAPCSTGPRSAGPGSASSRDPVGRSCHPPASGDREARGRRRSARPNPTGAVVLCRRCP